MDKKTKNLIIKHLRQATLKWRGRNEALKRAKKKIKRYKKNGDLHGTPYSRFECAHCKNLYCQKEIEVDHIIGIGSVTSWDVYIKRMFCNPLLLQVLCKQCHKLKKGNKYAEIEI